MPVIPSFLLPAAFDVRGSYCPQRLDCSMSEGHLQNKLGFPAALLRPKMMNERRCTVTGAAPNRGFGTCVSLPAPGRLYRPNRSERFGSRMLGNVKRGRGCLCGCGPGGGAPCGKGRLPGPEGPVVKKGAPGPENPGLRGTLGGGGGAWGKGLEATPLGGRGKCGG